MLKLEVFKQYFNTVFQSFFSSVECVCFELICSSMYLDVVIQCILTTWLIYPSIIVLVYCKKKYKKGKGEEPEKVCSGMYLCKQMLWILYMYNTNNCVIICSFCCLSCFEFLLFVTQTGTCKLILFFSYQWIIWKEFYSLYDVPLSPFFEDLFCFLPFIFFL